jgi:RES domain-containing protein
MVKRATTTVWRITRHKHADTAFSGIGAQKDGGRFNSAGTAVVYTSDSYALALFEARVHVPTFRGMRDRVVIEAEVDNSLVAIIDEADLPSDWQDRPPATSTQRLGDEWVASERSAVLRVPSVVVPGHANYILNPAHPDFDQIVIGAPRPVKLDPRLLKTPKTP